MNMKSGVASTSLCVVGLAVAAWTGLASCSGDDGAGGSGGGGGSCTDTVGEPDLLGDVFYDVNPVAPGDTLIVHLPVDSDTTYVQLLFLDLDSGTGAGFDKDFTVSAAAEQTLDLSVPVDPITSALDYRINVVLCTDAAACPVSSDKDSGPDGPGVATLYHDVAGQSVRDKIWDNGPGAESSKTCAALPKLSVR